MAAAELKLHDRVVYLDRDQLQWGPWEIVSTSGETVQVLVENRLCLAVNKHRLEKAERDPAER